MATPTLGSLTVTVPSHGMVPLRVTASLDVDGTTTGAAAFRYGRQKWEITKSDGTPLAGDEIQTCTRPVGQGGTVNIATDQEGFTFAYLITVPGTYKVTCTYINSNGESASVSSDDIVAAADTRTTYYGDGVNGNDSNDGLTPETAFLTGDKMYSIVNAANNRKAVWKCGTPCVFTGVSLNIFRSGEYWTTSKDGDKPVITGWHGSHIDGSEGFVVEGYQYGTGCRMLRVESTADISAGPTAVDCETDDALFCRLEGSPTEGNPPRVTGIYILRCEQLSSVRVQVLYVEGYFQVVMHGVHSPHGSTAEQSVRLMNSVWSENITLAWCYFANPDSIDDPEAEPPISAYHKGTLRLFARRFVTVFECYTTKGGWGFGEGGDSTDYLIERCHWDGKNDAKPDTNTNSIGWFSGSKRHMVRDCLIVHDHAFTSQTVVKFTERDTDPINFEDIDFVNCTFQRKQGNNRSIFALSDSSGTVSVTLVNFLVRNCIICPQSGATGEVFTFEYNNDTFEGWDWDNNVITDYGSDNAYFRRRVSGSSSTLNWSSFTSLSFVSNHVQETVAIASDGEPDGTLVQTAGAPTRLSYKSFNGVDRDYELDNWYAGAWQPEEDGGGPDPEPELDLGSGNSLPLLVGGRVFILRI